jgi:hypothetical protein
MGWIINIIAGIGAVQFPVVVGYVVALLLNRWHPSADERFGFAAYCGLVFFIDLCIVVALAGDRSEEMENLGGKLDTIANQLNTIQFQLNERAQKPKPIASASSPEDAPA